MSMHTTSASLIERLRQPAARRTGRVRDLYTPLLYNWAGRLGLSRKTRADLVQDVLMLLVRNCRVSPTTRSSGFAAGSGG